MCSRKNKHRRTETKRLDTIPKYPKRCKGKYQKNLLRLCFKPDFANYGRLTTIDFTHYRQRFSTTQNVFSGVQGTQCIQGEHGPLIWCQNSRFLCDLAAPSLSELLRSLSKRKFIVPRSESFFSQKREQQFRNWKRIASRIPLSLEKIVEDLA